MKVPGMVQQSIAQSLYMNELGVCMVLYPVYSINLSTRASRKAKNYPQQKFFWGVWAIFWRLPKKKEGRKKLKHTKQNMM